MAVRRLQKELQSVKNENCPHYTAKPCDDDNIFLWNCTIQGPESTPYEGGCFHLTLSFPIDYPFKSMTVQFTTKIYHPSFNEQGKSCLELLNHTWNPTRTVHQVLLHLISQLTYSHPHDFLMPAFFEHDREGFEAVAKEWATLHASNHLSCKPLRG
jgi:ubiquitin-conjugating enzyme E2 D/E